MWFCKGNLGGEVVRTSSVDATGGTRRGWPLQERGSRETGRRQVTCACPLQAAAAGSWEHRRIRSVHPAAEDPCTPAVHYLDTRHSGDPLDPTHPDLPFSIQKVLHTIIVDPTCPSCAYEDASKPRQHLQTLNWPLPAGRRSTPAPFIIHKPQQQQPLQRVHDRCWGAP